MGSHFSYSVQNPAGTINILSWGTVCPFSVWKCKQIKRRIKDVAINDKTVGVLVFLTLILSRTINLVDDSWWPSWRSLYWSKHEFLLTPFSYSQRFYSGSLCCQLSPWSHTAFLHFCCHFFLLHGEVSYPPLCHCSGQLRWCHWFSLLWKGLSRVPLTIGLESQGVVMYSFYLHCWADVFH